MVKKSITVTDEQAEWILAQIATEHYGSDGEAIRDALRNKKIGSLKSITFARN